MTPPRGTCEFCGEPVTAGQRAAFPVRGWQIERSQGGANQIAGRERLPNVIAHATCLERFLKRGNQMELMSD